MYFDSKDIPCLLLHIHSCEYPVYPTYNTIISITFLIKTIDR